MRRRQSVGSLSAEELAAEFDRLLADHPLSPSLVRAGLEAVGYDPVAAVRARRWLRHGRPRSWRWDLETDAGRRLSDDPAADFPTDLPAPSTSAH